MTQPIRQDILSITPEKLTQMANVGLVKRATKAFNKGDVPTLDIADDLCLTATFSDGHILTWTSNTGLADTQCTCPASMCRHRVQAVIAYRQAHDNPEVTITSPHTINATQLQSFANASILKKAEKLCQHGLSVRINPLQTEAKCPVVQLPMASIRFWGGANLHEATCDCIQKQGCEHILLAGVAYANLTQAPNEISTLQLGKADLLALLKPSQTKKQVKKQTKQQTKEQDKKSDKPAQSTEQDTHQETQKQNQTQTSPTEHTPETKNKTQNTDNIVKTDTLVSDIPNVTEHLDDAEKTLFSQLVAHGIGAGLVQYARLIEDVALLLKKSKAIWLQAILDDITEWLQAYENRRSDFNATQGFDLVCEYLLRKLAKNNQAYLASALGIGVNQETAIATARLSSLGCVVEKTDLPTSTHEEASYQAQIMLVDHNTASLMLYKHQWQTQPPADTGLHNTAKKTPEKIAKQISQQRISSRINLSQLAQGQLTCQRAKRLANHEIKLNRSRAAYNQVLPQQANWENLAPTICYDNIETLVNMLNNRPISVLSGRYSQPNFVVFKVDKVLSHGYDPAIQTYGAIVQDAEENIFWITRQYRAHLPFALEAMATAFQAAEAMAVPFYVSGVVSIDSFGNHTSASHINIIPWAIVTDKMYVPDVYMPKATANQLQKSQHINLIQETPQNPVYQVLIELKNTLVDILQLGATNQAMLDRYQSKKPQDFAPTLTTNGFTVLAEKINQLATLRESDNQSAYYLAILDIMAQLYLHLA